MTPTAITIIICLLSLLIACGVIIYVIHGAHNAALGRAAEYRQQWLGEMTSRVLLEQKLLERPKFQLDKATEDLLWLAIKNDNENEARNAAMKVCRAVYELFRR